MNTIAYLGIGTNLGERLAYLQGAVDGLHAADGVAVRAVSAVYETAPIGGPQQGAFLNAVVVVDTTLRPLGLLRVAQRLEGEAQRVRVERWGPRTLDVDVLLFGDYESAAVELTIPHPRLGERAFVLKPLADVAPEIVAARGYVVPTDQGVEQFGECIVAPIL